MNPNSPRPFRGSCGFGRTLISSLLALLGTAALAGWPARGAEASPPATTAQTRSPQTQAELVRVSNAPGTAAGGNRNDAAGPDKGGLTSGPLRVAFTKSCFANANLNDAEASFKTFMQIVGRKRGYLLQPSTQGFDDDPQFEAAIKSGSIQIAIMDSWQFLTMDIHQQVQPYFVSAERNATGKKYLLLTRRGSGLNTLADVRGTGLTALTVAGANLGQHWLDTLLLANRFGRAESFFSTVEEVPKPATAVLPVFFGKKPCCLVDQSSFDIMAELNPQVGQHLQVVAVSEPYLDLLICLGDTGWIGPQGKADCIASLSELHREPAGQQILTLFKIDRLVPFEEKQLNTVRELRAQQEQLLKEVQP